MTAILVAKNNTTWDIVYWYDWRATINNAAVATENAEKAIRFKNFTLLFSGAYHIISLIKNRYQEQFDDLMVENKNDALMIYDILKDSVFKDSTIKEEHPDRYIYEMIIVTNKDFYHMNDCWEFMFPSTATSKHASFNISTTGSGWEIALHHIHWSILHSKRKFKKIQDLKDYVYDSLYYTGTVSITCNTNIKISE